MRKIILVLVMVMLLFASVQADEIQRLRDRNLHETTNYNNYVKQRTAEYDAKQPASQETPPTAEGTPALTLVAGSEYSRTGTGGTLVLSGAVINGGDTAAVEPEARISLFDSNNTLLGTVTAYIRGGTNIHLTDYDMTGNAVYPGKKAYFLVDTYYDTSGVDHWTYSFQYSNTPFTICTSGLRLDGRPSFYSSSGYTHIKGEVMSTGEDKVAYFVRAVCAITDSSGRLIDLDSSYVDGDAYTVYDITTDTAIYPHQTKSFENRTITSYSSSNSYFLFFEFDEDPTADTPPVLRLTSPNGGEVFSPQTYYPITWESWNMSGSVKLEYSINNGSSWTTITTSAMNDGNYSWRTPQFSFGSPYTSCRVRISNSLDGSASDISGGTFTMLRGYALRITRPDDYGRYWEVGESVEIQWSATGVSGNLKVLITDLNGRPVTVISESTSISAGTLNYTVPATLPPGAYYLRIERGDVSHRRKLYIYNKADLDHSDLAFFDIRTGTEDSSPVNLRVLGGKLFFIADDGSDPALYRVDGNNPPVEVTEAFPGTGITILGDSCTFNGDEYFAGNNALWSYDGVDTPVKVADISVSGNACRPQQLRVVNNKLVFVANSSAPEYQLWEYDGTNPPYKVANPWPSNGDDPSLGDLTVYDGKLYFTASDGVNGRELWVYDGTNAPSMVVNTNPATGHDDYARILTVYGGKLFFAASDASYVHAMWEYDGVNPPTRFHNLRTYGTPAVFNNKLYFYSFDGYRGRINVYDGVNPSEEDTHITPFHQNLYVHDGRMYFTAGGDNYEYELWTYDGHNPPLLSGMIKPGFHGPNIESLTIYDGRLYFSADEWDHGTELWYYDGFTLPVTTIAPAASVTTASAALSGEVVDDLGSSVTSRGFCWGLNPYPSLADGNVAAGSGTGTFSGNLEGLQPGTTYHLRAYAVTAGGTGYSEDIAFTTPYVTPAAIELVSPMGGEDLRAGVKQEITWRTSRDIGNISIYYSTAGSGGSFVPIAAGTADSGSYTWTVPEIDSTQCVIKVASADGSVESVSNTFTVEANPVLNLTAPNGGEVFAPGATMNITWTQTRLSGLMSIYLYKDGGKLLHLATVNVSTGSFGWVIPQDLTEAGTYGILLARDLHEDASDSYFTVATPYISGTERAALIALYNGANGDGWTGNGGWKTAPLHSDGFAMPGTEGNWEGVTTSTVISNIHVTAISLEANNLTGAIPTGLGGLAQLKTIRLSDNRLSGAIPADWANLSNLETLEAGNNSFTPSAFPAGLTALVKLQTLHLQSVNLTGAIPATTGQLVQLTSLDLSGNQLSGLIPTEINQLAQLRTLNLASNSFSADPFPSWVSNLENLVELNLSGCNVTGGIYAGLNALSNLQVLRLGDNQLENSIPSGLGDLSNLVTLDLARNRLTGLVPSRLGDLANLRNLYLNGNQLDRVHESIAALTGLAQGEADFGYNLFYTTESVVVDFLDSVDSDWQATQTVRPTNLSAVPAVSGSVTFSWTPIAYTQDTGSYSILMGDVPGGPYVTQGTVSGKENGTLTINDLQNGREYYFVARATTAAHDNNPNTLVSRNTPEISVTIPVPSGTITVMAPDGGEVWDRCDIKTISWISSGPVGNVRLEYTTGGINGPYTLIEASTPNNGAYIWSLPAVDADQCLVRISEVNGSASDVSDNVFSIKPCSTITMTSPTGFEQWAGCTQQAITWNSTGSVAHVKIEYSTGGFNGTYVTVAESVSNTGSYTWTLPDADSSQCVVRVSQVGGNARHRGEDYFTISPCSGMNIISPNGGETLDAGSSATITWNYSNLSGNVLLQLYKGNASVLDLGTVPLEDGQLQWSIPENITAAGDYRIRGSVPGTGTEDFSDGNFTITTASVSPHPDINDDGKVDILWRNYTAGGGQNVVWYMNGVTRTGAAYLPRLKNIDWHNAGAGDFDGDGKTDLLWRYTGDGANRGQNAVWFMNGVTRTGVANLPRLSSLDWKIVDTADFNGDGKRDILWRCTTAGATQGQNVVWYMDGVTRTGAAYLPRLNHLDWNIVGCGDFNGDGKTDILWRYTADDASRGQNVVWYMDGTARTGVAMLPKLTDLEWNVADVADFNGDGKPDILWRNTGSGANRGQNVTWFMDGVTRTGVGLLPTSTDLTWNIEN